MFFEQKEKISANICVCGGGYLEVLNTRFVAKLKLVPFDTCALHAHELCTRAIREIKGFQSRFYENVKNHFSTFLRHTVWGDYQRGEGYMTLYAT